MIRAHWFTVKEKITSQIKLRHSFKKYTENVEESKKKKKKQQKTKKQKTFVSPIQENLICPLSYKQQNAPN